jgi:hypothetical protein
VSTRGGKESRGVAGAGGRKTGYSVSGVAHGDQVSIRDRKSRVKRVGNYSIWDGTDDAGRRGKRARFEDIVLLLPDGACGSTENGTRESRECFT